MGFAKMAIAENRLFLPLLSYESYMAEEEIFSRYEIIDGKRIFMPGATELHQIIVGNIYSALRRFGLISKKGISLMAPRDVMISENPFRVRQPDVLFISNLRRGRNEPSGSSAPYRTAPELVAEVISNSETSYIFSEKMADYQKANVLEVWKVEPELRTVEVMKLSIDVIVSTGIYNIGDEVQSAVFPELKVSVAEIFAE